MKQVDGHILTSEGFVAGTLEVRTDGRIARISGNAIEPARLREAPLVLPGFIDSLPEKDGVAQRVPMKRYGKMEEISELIAFLASDKAGYITGQNIRVDGGITRSV